MFFARPFLLDIVFAKWYNNSVKIENGRIRMKLLFVFTGGTIGSTEKNGVISVDKSKATGIIKCYEDAYGIDFDYDIIGPYNELSENNTGDNIRKLCLCVSNYIDKGYDGIIVTHGTDTLQYSAAALAYTLGLSKTPVCIVSANRPIEHEKSNALDNLRGAIRFICSRAGKGVFVVYRNDNSKTVRVHRGTRLVGVKAFSDDVSSIGGKVYGRFDKNFKFIKNPKYKEDGDSIAPISAKGLRAVNNKVLFLTPYVGMRYPTLLRGVKYVVFNTYHSGTLDTKSPSAHRFFESARERGIKVYAVGVNGGADYESALLFERLGITPLVNIAPIAAYMKLWLLTNAGIDTCELVSKSLSGDITPQICFE